jgi:hypothetical protein
VKKKQPNRWERGVHGMIAKDHLIIAAARKDAEAERKRAELADRIITALLREGHEETRPVWPREQPKST